MGTLQDSLRKAGVVSEKLFSETDAARQLEAEVEAARLAKPAKEKEKRFGILRETTNPDAFRREARRLLLLAPGAIQEVLNIAHAQGMHKKRDKGGMRLIANLYEVKNALSGVSDESVKHDVVDKLFSKR